MMSFQMLKNRRKEGIDEGRVECGNFLTVTIKSILFIFDTNLKICMKSGYSCVSSIQ